MTLKKDEIISAQAVLRPASGRQISLANFITAENVSQYEPSQESVEETSRLFRSLGFEVGLTVGISFSITAPVHIFVDVFEVRLGRNDRGGTECLGDDDTSRLELPMRALPKELARHLYAVTFTPPPDFGPTDF